MSDAYNNAVHRA